MAFPPQQKAWTISYNNVITGATLNEMMSNYLFAVSQFFLANGYVCKGSCDGTTGAMDGVNRWGAPTDCDTRGATTAAANSWMVMTDNNGCDILLSYIGSSDDRAYLAYSPAGLYVAAGTPAFTPTATDELILATGATTVINTTAAATSRHLFMWVDSLSQMARVLLTLDTSNSPCGIVWGVEVLDTSLQDQTIAPSVWGFFYAGSDGSFCLGPGASAGFMSTFVQNQRGGRSRVNGNVCNMNGSIQQFVAGAAGSFSAPWCNVQTELQGGAGYPIWGPLRVGSDTSGYHGVVGQLFDWWSCRFANSGALAQAGDTYDNLNYMAVGNGGGLLWPGDGVTTPVTGVQASIAQPGEHTGFENADPPSYGSFLNGVSMYVPFQFPVIDPTTPVAATSFDRRPGSEIIEIIPMTGDPPAEVDRALLYSRTIDGALALFMRYPDGTVVMVGSDQ